MDGDFVPHGGCFILAALVFTLWAAALAVSLHSAPIWGFWGHQGAGGREELEPGTC